MHLRAAPTTQKSPSGQRTPPVPFQLDGREVDARYDAALAIPFPSEILEKHSPHVWGFCVSRGQALSSSPAAIYMALHSLACFELPNVVARYTELLDVPAVTWKLQLGKSGDGKSLVVNFIKEILKDSQSSPCSTPRTLQCPLQSQPPEMETARRRRWNASQARSPNSKDDLRRRLRRRLVPFHVCARE